MVADEKSNHDGEKAKPEPQDKLSVTKHSVKIAGKEIKYSVTAGTIVLKEESVKKGDKDGEFEGNQAKAEVFFVAYSRDGVRSRAKRPLTFSFNGGPGSSSVWLHLGVLGPRRVVVNDTEATPPPYQLTDNEYSLLDETDLVFIDPVSTGYSRPVEGKKAKDFHSLKRDIESVGDFIRLYTTRYERWLSPKFIAGESYGTTRAAALSGYLQERHGLFLNGLMLISCAVDLGTVFFAPPYNNHLPYSLFIPTYTATAWYHKKLPEKLQKKKLRKVLDEVEAFVRDEYVPALFKGSSLNAKDRKAISQKLAMYTGLSESFVERCKQRISMWRFSKELLRDEGLTVGRIDSRYTGRDRDQAGEGFEYDPSIGGTVGAYTASLNYYVRTELGYSSDLAYEVLSMDVNRAWKWETENSYVSTADTMRKAMNMNPHLKVHVANGYYDLATPHFASEYTFNHLGLDEALQGNISMSYYEAGHMMYVHRPSLRKMKEALAKFIQATLA